MNNVFGVVRLLVEWQNRRIGYDVVDEIRARRTGISQIVHLDGCRTKREDAEAFVLGMTVEVNRNIDLKILDEPRNLSIALRPDVDELVERRDNPCSHVAAVIRAQRHSEHLELRAVVPLE